MRRPRQATRPAGVAATIVATILVLLTGCGTDGPGSTTQPSTTGPAPVTSADATAPKLLVNLGDSFAAAVGVRPLVADSPVLCQRSASNYGHLLAERRGLRLRDVTCGGAATPDFFAAQYDGVPPQLDAVTDDADIVTVMVGGNDGDVYTRAITECAAARTDDPQGAPCRARHGTEFTDLIVGETAPALRRTFEAIRTRAPKARILAVGYPWILPPTTGCAPEMPVATGDIGYLRALQATLNRAVADAARATGADFVDMSDRSVGHDACAEPGRRWIEPRQGASGAAPVHPNADGQRAIADAVDAVL